MGNSKLLTQEFIDNSRLSVSLVDMSLDNVTSPDPQDSDSFQYSLKSLLLVTTVVAILVTVISKLGINLVPYILLAAVVGFTAHRDGKLVPYWKAVFAASFWLAATDDHYRYWTDEVAIAYSIGLGFGSVFAFSAIRHGNWQTKIIAAVAMLLYVIMIAGTLIHGIGNMDGVIEYWAGT